MFQRFRDLKKVEKQNVINGQLLPITLKTRCMVEGVRTARVWFMSGHVLSEFLKMNPMLFIMPLTKMLHRRPVTVAMTATPLEEFIHSLTRILRGLKINHGECERADLF